MFIKMVLKFLISIATLITSQLPDHTPIEFPDVGGVVIFFRSVNALHLFVDVPSIFLVVGIILIYSFAKLLYGAYRVILGLIPALK